MTIPAGALRFNSDSGKLEYYNGEAWWQIDNFSADNATGGARGIIFGTNTGNTTYITISTTGNAIDFGAPIVQISQESSCSSKTRALRTVGYSPSTAPIACNVIEYVTISSTGNHQDFGDSVEARRYATSLSNSTRGLTAGGNTPNPNTNLIDYVTIASKGDAVTFGDLFDGRVLAGGAQSSTRGVIAGGESPGTTNNIEFITISTLGNGADFGDLTIPRYGVTGCSNSTRGIFASGYAYNVPAAPTTAIYNVIEYLTISTLGDSLDFGDLTVARSTAGACSSPTRGVFCGGTVQPTSTNVMDYIQIMSTGNAIDFGDLLIAEGTADGATSNAHGGL